MVYVRVKDRYMSVHKYEYYHIFILETVRHVVTAIPTDLIYLEVEPEYQARLEYISSMSLPWKHVT